MAKPTLRSMKRDEAAYLIWPVLTNVSRSKDKIYYSQLADTIGAIDRRLGWPLRLIQEYCLTGLLPPLTILVVSKADQAPGHGFTAWDLNEREAGYTAVWDYPWPTENPFQYATSGQTLEGLADDICDDPNVAEQVYALVAVRGAAQMVFRQAVLAAYGHRCAICRLSIRECLEAAHIIPWSAASAAQRVSPTNGLCLCANHHRLFDRGMMTITVDGLVACEQARLSHPDRTSDQKLTMAFHGKKAHLPGKSKLRPSPEALAYRLKALE
ncbi:HNH endonuclease [Sphingomonas sp. 28-63-12]|uniref:HNH endonuclease n=1 Tax=Sphingomonas sp. 28-63-12 TaxID=1970434 RepID=UPI000BCC79F6|nr:MAG: hypothetical protein B7Y47_12495 [Sphingomonas sp. 28-63-12]